MNAALQLDSSAKFGCVVYRCDGLTGSVCARRSRDLMERHCRTCPVGKAFATGEPMHVHRWHSGVMEIADEAAQEVSGGIVAKVRPVPAGFVVIFTSDGVSP